MEIVGPRTYFPVELASAYGFIAGGIDTTSILPRVQAVAKGGRPFRVVYGVCSRTSMAFVENVESYGDRALIVPQDECGMIDIEGILGAGPSAAAVYCCGPEPLIAAAEAACRRLSIGSLHFERFAPAADAIGSAHEEGDGAFEADLAHSGYAIFVGADQTLLEVLESAGVYVASDCREGICGSCEVPVLSGKLAHRDAVLSKWEREAGNLMMTCVSRAASERIELNL